MISKSLLTAYLLAWLFAYNLSGFFRHAGALSIGHNLSALSTDMSLENSSTYEIDYIVKRRTECITQWRSKKTGPCERLDCERLIGNDDTHGICRTGSDGGCESINIGPNAPRFSCQPCICAPIGNPKDKLNGKSKTKKTNRKLGSHVSRMRLDLSGASLTQFATLHNAVSVAFALSSWIMLAPGYGKSSGLYERTESPEPASSVFEKVTTGPGSYRISLLHPVTLEDRVKTREIGETMILNNATAEIDDNGLVSAAALQILAPHPVTVKRADWSSINLEYTSEEGHREIDAYQVELEDLIYDLIAFPTERMSGVCAAIIDDHTYWGTFKIWTGTEQEHLGDCPCSNLAYPGVFGEDCGWRQDSEDTYGDPDYVY
ncbi:uncharacterized protein I303_101099 [Kwoniella dejecticola CBS 10117]|uniref:Uncharacterized protein n=1 Tax=Kwoniella dejecticola CBS 10117 TaxID=1296121 RepID=A0A1A6AGZ1_9TREE|nr:uncharacterized protein I303_01103 [Kwoniella dejecticola CBS 10117]OBR89278.1 hypothetical protein I303_01103 [Kwoniella dejecticola CBS 10117]